MGDARVGFPRLLGPIVRPRESDCDERQGRKLASSVGAREEIVRCPPIQSISEQV